MSEESNSRGGGFGLGLWLTLAAAPLFYVLSIGPAAMIVNKTRRGQEVVKVMYAPVIWLHDYTPLRKPLEAYVDLWEGR